MTQLRALISLLITRGPLLVGSGYTGGYLVVDALRLELSLIPEESLPQIKSSVLPSPES